MHDKPFVQILTDKLNEWGISTETLDNVLSASLSWDEQIKLLIVNAKNIVIFIAEQSLNSKFLAREIHLAYEYAKTRDKNIIPVLACDNQALKATPFSFLLESQLIIYIKADGSSEHYIEAAEKIYDILANSEGKELLYEKISNLSKINYIPGLSSNLCDLIMLLCDEAEHVFTSAESRRGIYKELLRCMEQLQDCLEPGYSDEDRKLAHKRLDTLNRVNKLLGNSDFHSIDLFLISFVIKMIYLDYDIRNDIIDTLTNGDVHVGDEYAKGAVSKQDFYLKIYNSQMVAENITEDNHGKYTEDEVQLILQAKKFVLTNTCIYIEKHKEANLNEISDTENQLYAIADYMKQSNKLFELVGNNCLAVDFLKCLKTSYERLRKYSEIVGCLEICAECIERIAEINHQLEQMAEANFDAGIAEYGLKALLGFSLPGAGEFDVFLSYKHEDADIARNIYHFLKSNLLNPFFDSISLPELSKSEYEDAIMNAIEHSKHFVVVISDLDYLKSYWVELEMKTFRHEMVEGRKKDANFIMVVTKDVFQKIVDTNKQCLPIKYRSYEIMRVEDYKNSIVSYLK